MDFLWQSLCVVQRLTTYRGRLLVALVLAAVALSLWLWSVHPWGRKYPAPSPRLSALAQSLLKVGGTSCSDADHVDASQAAADHIRLVCISPDRVDFRVSTDPRLGGLAYVTDPHPTELFAAECVRHLTGPWWQYAGPNPNCPFGEFLEGG